jgi:hypothetical protein
MKRLIAFLAVLLATATIALAGVSWLQETGGATKTAVYTATVTTDTNVAQIGTIAMYGTIVRVAAIPHIATTAQTPLAAWDCSLQDENGADISASALSDMLNTTATSAALYGPPMVNGAVKLTCQNMGTSKTAWVKVYVQQ